MVYCSLAMRYSLAAGQVMRELNDSNEPQSPDTKNASCINEKIGGVLKVKEGYRKRGILRFRVLKLEGVDMHDQSSERLALLDASVPSFARDIVRSIKNEQKVLEEDFTQRRSRMKLLEENVKLLNLQQAITKAEIHKLGASLDYDYSHDLECIFGKELVMDQIACKRGSAAAVICRIFQCMSKKYLEQGNDFTNNILGVVACLGIAQTNGLSRILAKYLGEDLMLGIVCKSHAFASSLAEYEPDGRVNSAYGLHALAADLELPINKEFDVICLDNLSVYTGDFCSNSRRKLALPDPTLSNGNPPPGFLGFAVNLIDPGVGCWHWRTSSGHGLRETLLYHLFGKLQVYENREDMNKASSCLTEEGAVSLDGGITKNGTFTVGCWEPDVKFPVICSETRRHFSAHSVGIMEQVDEKKQEIQERTARLKREEEKLIKEMKKLNKMNDRCMKFFHEKAPLLRDFYIGNGKSKAGNNSAV